MRSRRSTARSPTSSISAPPATRRTTSATPTTAPHLGLQPVLEPDLPHRRRRRSGQAEARKGDRDVPRRPAFGGPHSPYALPGRMLFSFLARKDGGLPAGLAEFNNDGKFIRQIDMPGRRTLHVRRRRSIPTSTAWSRQQLHADQQLQEAARQDGLQEVRQGAARLGFPPAQGAARLTTGRRPAGMPLVAQGRRTTTASPIAPSTIRSGSGKATRTATTRPASCCTTGKLPADLRQSPDDRYLYVSCFVSNEIQQWDVSDLKARSWRARVKPGVQPNMMHVTGDGKRMYITNSLLSTMDRVGRVLGAAGAHRARRHEDGRRSSTSI